MYNEEIIKGFLKNEDYTKLESYLDQYLGQNPEDIDVWLKLAVFLIIPGIADYEKSIYCCEQALSMKPDHLDSLVMLATIYHLNYGFIEEKIVQKLFQTYTNDKEYQSMIWLLRAWGIKDKRSMKEYEEALLSSIKTGPDHVLNHVNLAYFYQENGKFDKMKDLLVRALNNIRGIYQFENREFKIKKDYYVVNNKNVLDYQEFLNERVKGIHVTDGYVHLLENDILRS